MTSIFKRHSGCSDSIVPECTIFLPGFEMGGVERVLINLTAGMRNAGTNVEIAVCSNRGEYREQALSLVPVRDLKAGRVINAVFPLVRYLRERKPKCIISGKNYTSIVALWARSLSGVNTKVVVTIHTMASKNEPEWQSTAARLVPALMKNFYVQADALVAVSHAAAADAAQVCGLPLKRFSVIYNPVITDDFYKSINSPLSPDWMDGHTGPIVLAAGRLSAVKGFGNLIRAFSGVPKYLNAKLLILGDGPEREKLIALIKTIGLTDRVLLPGCVSSPQTYMKNSNLFVLSSLWECLPTVIIEALAVGLPIVAFDCPGGLREIVSDKDLIVFVPPGDTNALAKAITDQLRKERTPTDIVDLSEFTSSKSVCKYLDLINNLNQSHPNHR